MKRSIFHCVFVTVLCGCGDADLSVTDRPYGQSQALRLNDRATMRELVRVPITLNPMNRSEGTLTSASIEINLSCDDVYGPVAGDWYQTSAIIDLTSDSATINLPSGYACYATLLNYFDGTNTYTAVASALVIDISSSGVVSSGGAAEYTSGGESPTNYWFNAASGGAWSIDLYFANDAVDSISAGSTTLSSDSLTVAITGGGNTNTIINLSCDDVYGDVAGDWFQDDLSIDTTTTATVSIISGTTCNLTLDSYYDGVNTYTPSSSPLVVEISEAGAITDAGPLQYSSGGEVPVCYNFSATQGISDYQIVISYTPTTCT